MIENIKKYKTLDELELAGVYILWKNGYPVYIGASGFLISRIKSHKHHKQWDSFSIIPVLNEDERGKLESELIKKYCPIHNSVNYKTTIHYSTSYKNKNYRYEKEKEILQEFKIPPSCRMLQKILYKKYGIVISHVQCNADLKKFYRI
jgi:hypothetical protein